MNRADEGPVLQLLTCPTEILQGLTVQKLNLAHCRCRSHKPGNVVDDLPPGELTRAHRILSPLAILDVNTGSVPFEDVARFTPEWIGANQEPSIRTVESSNPSFRVNRSAGSQPRFPLLEKSLTVLGVNRFRPPPALRLFGSYARVIEPHLVEEVAVAIRAGGPCRRGDRIDDGAKIALARVQSLFRTCIRDGDRGLICKQT